jgi:LuxR family maltose regulon positive regulatory protein
MTSTTSEPAVRSGARNGRPQQRAGPRGAGQHGVGQLAVRQREDRAALHQAERHQAERRRLRVPAQVKTAVPRPSVRVLPRPRVTELIERASAKHRVTLVCGPSGAGKSIACADWAASAPAAGSVGWLSLDYGDRWPRQLWANVRAALASIPTLPGGIAGDLPDPADDGFPLHLIRLAESLTAPVTLVIDDISDLAGASVLAGVDQLIRNAPPTLRLVLSGRHPAGLQVARLRVGGELGEIGAADLACTPEEAEAYFRMHGHEVPAAERDELLRRTQGWMTGLRLAAMRIAPGKPGSTVSRITGSEPAVADYLWDEVLASLPAERRMFLLRTSVADVICGDLADALGAGSDGAAILDELSRENLMVGPADADQACTDRAEYRYHPMLLDMLRARLRSELPGESVRLTRRASRWLAARGRHAEAIRSAARAGDWDFAGRVLAEAGPAMLVPGPAAELEPVLATFPASRFAADAAVAGTLAAAGLRTGDTCAAALHLDNAEQALGHCAPAQRQRVATWLQALRLMTGDWGQGAEGVVARSHAIATEAEHTAQDAAEQQGVGLLWCALGVAELATPDVAAARSSFARARRYLREARPEFSGRARAWLALAEAVYGDLAAASDLLAARDLAAAGDPAGVGEFADDPTAAGDQDGRLVVDALTCRLAGLAAAYVHLTRDEPAAARAALDRCEPEQAGPPGGDQDAAPDPMTAQVLFALVSAARVRLALAEDDLGAARAFVNRIRYQSLNAGQGLYQGRSPDTGGSPALERFLAPLEAEIALRDGDHNRARLALAQAAQASRAGPDSEAGPGGTGGSSLLLAQARLQLAQGDNAGALSTVRPCLEAATGGVSQLTLQHRVGALVTAAIAARRLGQAEAATSWLTDALNLAEPQGMYRPFLDGGAAVRSALTVLIRPASQAAAFAVRVLQRFERVPSGQAAATSVPLTSSELAVLRFLPSHMTNQEIADALFLSINTVKTHLRSVYRKLGVTTRRQAIARGGQLGLL